MKLLSPWILILCIGVSTLAYAQQDPQFTQYMYNTMIVNPAYAGSRGHGVFTALARTQWVGFEGAPETQTLSYDTPLGVSGLGLGINVMNDKIGPSHEIYFDANMSYAIETGYDGNLAFGLRLGGRVLNIDWSKGRLVDDETLFDNNINGRFLPTVGAGIYYYTPEWYLGISVPNFLRSEHYDQNLEAKTLTAVERMHFFMIAGYVFQLGEDVKLKPAALVKAVSGAPVSIDLSANVLFSDRYRAGLGWRWGDSISALLGIQVSNALMIGYAYDLTTSNYNVINSGTHEVFVRYELVQEYKYRSPRFF
ncbi:conserved exported hypothetical protein [Tenacibaculum litopenaei]|uniref:PorP/SprF family type IX secretion system membrane protein n=1 Tax=Tenacibaculum litopenaei TaxID=396016 RepID=UPI0038947F8E